MSPSLCFSKSHMKLEEHFINILKAFNSDIERKKANHNCCVALRGWTIVFGRTKVSERNPFRRGVPATTQLWFCSPLSTTRELRTFFQPCFRALRHKLLSYTPVPGLGNWRKLFEMRRAAWVIRLCSFSSKRMSELWSYRQMESLASFREKVIITPRFLDELYPRNKSLRLN